MARLLASTVLVAAVVCGLEVFARPHVGSGATAVAVCGGVNRWNVKTLSDLRGPNPPLLKRDAEVRTIAYLVTQPHDKIGTQTARLLGVERTKYVLKDVTLVEAKVQEDQDLHLVIRDNQTPRNQMRHFILSASASSSLTTRTSKLHSEASEYWWIRRRVWTGRRTRSYSVTSTLTFSGMWAALPEKSRK